MSFSQTNELWKGYYSYNEIKDISFGDNSVTAATENALFSKNSITNELQIRNSIDGFRPSDISTIYYSSNYNLTLVGNTNGLIIVVKEDGTIINKIDVINEVPVPPNNKKINHFYEYEDKVYIATDYGISVLKLSNLEFEDTFYIGNSGEPTSIIQTTIYNDNLYAVTESFGIKRASITNPNLIDFNQWQNFDLGSWKAITNFNNQLVALNANNTIQKHNGTNFQTVFSLFQTSLKFISNSNHLIVTSNNNVYVLDVLFSVVKQVTQIPNQTNVFTCAVTQNNNLYIGTKSKGLFQTNLTNASEFISLSPNGPDRNLLFRVKKTSDYLWAVYGAYDPTFTPNYSQEGISKYSDNSGWETIPFTDLFGVTTISNIAINPLNENDLFFASHHDGMLRIKEGIITEYNESNTGSNGLQNQELVDPNYISVRINGPAFDKAGNAWVTNAFTQKSLKVLKTNGQWQSYDMSAYLEQTQAERYSPLVIDKNNTKWIPCYWENGLVAFNENLNNKVILINEEDQGNLPSKNVRCLAIDKRNQLWIGTFYGLRIISSVDKFLNDTEITTTAIIIEEDGLAQELFYQQSILDIAVDGANNKWVSIANAGVFLVSPNGQSTLYRFTKENSPLPSNNIIDIEIDDVSGEVYFATDKGMISFLGSNTKGKDDLSNVVVYPNPVRPNYNGTVKITGLLDKANIKITDVEGNLVHETTSAGGTIEWDTTAFGKYKVASGVYLIFITSDDALETKVKKVMIVR